MGNAAWSGEGSQQLTITVQRHPSLGLRFTCSAFDGWSRVAKGPFQIANAIGDLWRMHDEHRAAIARARYIRRDTGRGTAYSPGRAVVGRAVAAITDWCPLGAGDADVWDPVTKRQGKCPAGSWLSPKGNVYGPHTVMAQRIAARRKAAGLPGHPDHEHQADAERESA